MSTAPEPSTYYKSLVADCVIDERLDPIDSWSAFQRFAEQTDGWKGWHFRGQARWSWEPESTLRRQASTYGVTGIRRRELGMLRRFMREFGQHQVTRPADDDYVQWLALMQHHGAPTRLLDVTYSVYVALFFATIDNEPEQESALWCFNTAAMVGAFERQAPRGFVRERARDAGGVFRNLWKILLNHRKPKVYLLSPYEMPTRLTRQQGGFHLSLDIEKPYIQNLSSMIGRTACRPAIVKQKLRFDQEELKIVLQRLNRMNINYATLFPGLDGFARDLKVLMTIPEATHSYSETFV